MSLVKTHIREFNNLANRHDLIAHKTRLDLAAVESCLRNAQTHFSKINATLSVKRTPPSDEVINNLLAGYALIDDYLSKDIDLFSTGNSELILSLNQTVLYHSSPISSAEAEHQFKATTEHFYEAKNGGIGDLMEWLALNESSSIWKRSAGLFTYILSQPQLFLEGNHRTGSLMMSYMLMRKGHAPFVLSPSNAKHFFEPAELTKKRRKKTLDEYLLLPKQTRQFAKLLKQEQSERFFYKATSAN